MAVGKASVTSSLELTVFPSTFKNLNPASCVSLDLAVQNVGCVQFLPEPTEDGWRLPDSSRYTLFLQFS